MSSPVKNTSGKRSYNDQAQSPVSSPSKPSPQKRVRSSLNSSINGLPVEPQSSPGQSPSKASPSKIFDQNLQSERSRARMDLRAVFREEPAPAQTQASVAASSIVIPEAQESQDSLFLQTFLQSNKQLTLASEPAPAPAQMAAAASSSSSNQRQIRRNLNICHQVALRQFCSAHLRCDSTTWREKANLHLLKNDFASAARCNLLAATDAKQPSSEKKKLLETLLVQLIQTEDLPQALVVCNDFDRQFPDVFSIVPWVRAYCALKQKNYEQCFELLTMALDKREAYSDDANANISEEDLALHDELISKMMDALQIAKEEVQGNTELTLFVLNRVFELTQRINDHHQALAALQEIEALLPGSSMLFQGISYWCLEMPEDGVECFVAASENRDAVEGASFDRLIKVALILKNYAALDRNELALNTSAAYCDWAIEELTTHEERLLALRMKYDCCVLLGQYGTALEIMQQLETLVPEDSSPLLFQGICYFKLNRPVEGLQAYRRAYESRHNNRIVDENILDACIKDMIFGADFDLFQKFGDWSIELILNRAN